MTSATPAPPPRRTAMTPRQRRQVLVGLAAAILTLMAAGAVAAWFSRNDTICGDGRPPVAQRAIGLGQIEYRCHNGELVTK